MVDHLEDLERRQRRFEEDTIDELRKRAKTADVEQLAKKQSEGDSDMRSGMNALRSESQEIRTILRSIDDRMDAVMNGFSKHRRENEQDVQNIKQDVAALQAVSQRVRLPPVVSYGGTALGGGGLAGLAMYMMQHFGR